MIVAFHGHTHFFKFHDLLLFSFTHMDNNFKPSLEKIGQVTLQLIRLATEIY